MAMFPRIQNPCPYRGNLAAVMDGDFCRMCKRTVVDLTAWSDDERVSFLGSCKSEVCVSYRLPVKPALIAAAFAASVAALPAAAQDAPAVTVMETGGDDGAYYDLEVLVGGITDPNAVEFVVTEDQADASIPELPVVYETPVAERARLRDAS